MFLIVVSYQCFYQLFENEQLMLRKNKNLPNFLSKEIQQPAHTQIQLSARPHILSPPTNFYRLERKPREQLQPKSSSLNNRLKKRVFPEVQTSDTKLKKGKGIEIDDEGVINDYFPERLQKKNQPIPFSASFNNLQQTFKVKRQSITQYMSSSPNLTNQNLCYETDDKDKRDQQSVSTELSKQSQNDLKNSLKEVKFGGVIQQEHHLFMKKRDKARSPSILKNGSRNILNGSILSGSKQRSISVTSGKDRKPKEKVGGEHTINHVIKQKYKSIINKLQAVTQSGYGRSNRFSGAVYQTQKIVLSEMHKYRDDIFPPVYSSLFCIKKNRPKVGEQIKWMRLGDLFKQRDMVLAKSKYTSIQITKHDEGYCQDYFPGTFNCLLGCPKILQKIFENQAINPFGIYLIKIYQQCVWKYIIVDDYIPVLKTREGIIVPAFTTVKTAPDSPIDIWPFLLQKAYANYYSSYESLQHGCMVDLAEQLTGTPSECIQLKSESTRKKEKMSVEQSETNLKKAKKAIKAGNTMVVGQLCGDKGFAPIFYDCFNEQLFWNDPFCQFKKRRISFQSLKDTFKTLHIVSPFTSVVCSSTILRKTRPTGIKKELNGLFQADLPSIRAFKIQHPGQYKLSIRQRDKRFFHFKETHGEYIWCRALLLQKEYEECGFRWINGCYAQSKSINFIQTLEVGQYWVVLEPQWRSISANQLSIHLYGGAECEWRRQVYRPEEKIIEKGCLDLAQRYGQLNQINKFICSYNYITERVGFIIENIINERVTGNVSVMRSIRGLKCKSQILPVNEEFYQSVTTIDGDTLLKLNEEVELDIPSNQHFTVVLKLKGGIDSKFFRTFDFGC